MSGKKCAEIVRMVFICLSLNLAYPAITPAANERDNTRKPFEKKAMPERLRRSESFLGIHFDFHASNKDVRIGENVTRQMVENIINKVKPDYIQCDCKGHSGFSSYPTKVGNQAGGFVRDPLRIWREVTAKHGVALYMHYSGVWDNEAVKHHPEWARINEKGEKDNRLTSVYGPYVDKLLIPQLKELCDEYGVDGVWIDGECWATERDYAESVIKAFQKQTGIKNIPRKAAEPHWFEFSEFCRDGFRNYLKRYVTEVHKHNPNFQIASNWAYSSMMPEPVTIDVDFLSGDYSSTNSINTARFEGRCLMSQAKPWDLMAWSFVHTWKDTSCFNVKSIPQLQQEAAIVLALGGGFQAYFRQGRDGSIHDWQMNIMSGVAKFCRDRQKFCHRAKPVPQVALLYSGEAFYRSSKRLFAEGGLLVPLRGVLQSLLDSQYSVEILMEHHLRGKMQEYPIIIVPEWSYLPEDFKDELLAYVNQGGSLLVIGPKAAAVFKEYLGVSFQGKPEVKKQWLEHNGRLAGSKTLYQKIKIGARAKAFGKFFPGEGFSGDFVSAASIAEYGKGKIAATYFNFGERYCNASTDVARNFLDSLVRRLHPEPIVEVTGSHNVDVSVNRINGKLAVNLVNTSGPHANKNIHVFDEIPCVGPLKISIRSRTKPRKVILEPTGKEIAYKYTNGKVELTLARLEIHEIIVIE